jgi:hypothetical protein
VRLCTLRTETGEDVGVAVPGGIVALSLVNAIARTGYGPTMLDVILRGEAVALAATIALAARPRRGGRAARAEIRGRSTGIRRSCGGWA